MMIALCTLIAIALSTNIDFEVVLVNPGQNLLLDTFKSTYDNLSLSRDSVNIGSGPLLSLKGVDSSSILLTNEGLLPLIVCGCSILNAGEEIFDYKVYNILINEPSICPVLGYGGSCAVHEENSIILTHESMEHVAGYLGVRTKQYLNDGVQALHLFYADKKLTSLVTRAPSPDYSVSFASSTSPRSSAPPRSSPSPMFRTDKPYVGTSLDDTTVTRTQLSAPTAQLDALLASPKLQPKVNLSIHTEDELAMLIMSPRHGPVAAPLTLDDLEIIQDSEPVEEPVENSSFVVSWPPLEHNGKKSSDRKFTATWVFGNMFKW